MSKPPVIVVGHLGWSNMRGGVEFYEADPAEPRASGRWGTRIVGDPEGKWGRLLGDRLEANGGHEGQTVIVIALSGRAITTEAEAIQAVKDALGGSPVP